LCKKRRREKKKVARLVNFGKATQKLLEKDVLFRSLPFKVDLLSEEVHIFQRSIRFEQVLPLNQWLLLYHFSHLISAAISAFFFFFPFP
jgi:hypothetical protein